VTNPRKSRAISPQELRATDISNHRVHVACWANLATVAITMAAAMTIATLVRSTDILEV